MKKIISLILLQFAAILITIGQEAGNFKGYIDCLDSKIYYETSGTGPVIILAHAGYLDTRMWDNQFEFLADNGFKVIRFDHFGHGKTIDGKNSPFHWEVFEAIMKHFNTDKATIIGCSMGSRAAIEFAIEKPEMVESLILGSPGLSGYDFNSDQLFRPLLRELLEAYSDNDTLAAIEAFTKSWTDGPYRTTDQIDPAVRGRIKTMIADRYRNHGFIKNAMEIYPKAIKQLNKIEQPCLILTAGQDMPSIIGIAEILDKEIKKSSWEKIEKGGHMINMEYPDTYNTIIINFLLKN